MVKRPVEPDTDSSGAPWPSPGTPMSPGGRAVPLEAVICTEALERRASRPADHEAESRVLRSLLREMADAPAKILQTLVDAALTLCRAQSAGISLLHEENDLEVFVWRALAGRWSGFLGYSMPRALSPCGAALDRNAPLLMSYPERHFVMPPAAQPVTEALVMPFYVAGGAAGTLWIVAHDEARGFDAEDKRLLASLGTFASMAYRALTAQEREARATADMLEKRAATQLLQNISTRLIREGDVDALYRQILDAATDLMRSDMASMQMYYSDRGALRLLAWKEFAASSAAFWEWVHAGSGSTCGEALRTGSRVIVPDVEACEFIAGTPDADAYRASGIRAVQSTPLVSRSGQPLGMISTHWREPHQPSERDLHLFDVLVRQAADLIERAQAEIALRRSEANLRHFLESAPIAIHWVDAAGVIIWANRAELQMLGYAPDEYVGRHVAEFHVDQAAAADILKSLRDGETIRNVEARLRHKDGSIRYGAIYSNVVREDGRFAHTRCFTLDVTEKKKLEEKTRAQFDELENVYRTAPIGLALIDKAFCFTRINERLAEINGVSAEQHIGRSLREIIPSLAGQAEEVVRRVFRTGKPVLDVEFQGETRARPGVRRTWNESWYPLTDAAGETVAVSVVVEEITARKRAEQALAESVRIKDALYHLADRLHRTRSLDDVYSAALDAILSALQCDRASILLFDQAGAMRFVAWRGLSDGYRKAVEGHSPWTPDETNPTPISIGNIDTADLGEPLKSTIQAEGIGAAAFIPLVSNGKLIGKFMTYFNAPHAFTDDEVELAMTIARQLAFGIERKRAEALLRSNAKQLALITGTAPVFIAYCDAQARFKFVNKAYAARFGLTPEQCIGKRIPEVVGEQAYEALRKYIDIVLRGKPAEFEVAIPYAVIGERFMHCSYAPEVDASGNVVGFVGAVTDITERRDVEEALRRSEERLKEADRRKDEFLATLAHELRNPLAPLHYALHAMKLKGNDAETVERSHAMMERQLGHMVRLIDDLLDVSRISRGKVELRKERAELAGIVHQAIETNRPLAEASGLDLVVELPAEPIAVDADVARVAQVVDNLLNNACKFTPAGGRIRLAVERDGPQAVVRVQDTGVGIAADQVPRIFEMFAQVDTSLERTQGGLGIGLTLAKTLAEMHGGTVEVRSAGVGYGSEFSVRLPVAAGGPAAARAEPAPAAGESAPAASLRILVVDDNVDSAGSLAALLDMAGHDTRVAHDGLEAVQTAAAFKPEVVLLDIGLPKLNGYDVARRIREQPWGAGVVLVALTGWGQDNDREKSKDAGFDNHLVKPLDHAALLKLFTVYGRVAPPVAAQAHADETAGSGRG